MNDNIFARDGFYWWIGVVEDRNDPEKIGRCRVRILGYHIDNKEVLPTGDLPWAVPMQPITSAGISGKGSAPIGPLEGSWVIGFFMDGKDKQQPMILGTMGGLPDKTRSCGAQEGNVTNNSDNVLRDGSGNVVKDGSGNPIITNSSNSTVAKPAPTNQAIQQNLEKIVLACKKQGITNHYFVAAVLANALKESKGKTIAEISYRTTPYARIVEVFGNARLQKFPPEQWDRIKQNDVEFFDHMYGVTCSDRSKPEGFKHFQVGDGFKYRGRGFIQFTGKSLYSRLSQLAYGDERFVSNPDLLLDPDNAANATAAFMKLSIQSGTAMKLTGVSYPPTSQANADILVTSMVGGGGDIRRFDYGRKILAIVNGYSPAYTVGATPGGVRVAELLGQTQSQPQVPPSQPGPNTAQPDPQTTPPTEILNDPKLGHPDAFKDPNSVYPTCEYTDRPDTNKLATGDTKGTIVETKNDKRSLSIGKANGGSWDEPESAYCARYPHNHVIESESGHVFEMDDTPDRQRLHLYHRTGTFVEIDQNGTWHQRVVGDHYGVFLRNNHVYIKGDYDVTVDNATRLQARDVLEIEVLGKTTINVKNDAVINVAGNLNTRAKNVFMEAEDDFHIKAGGNMYLQAASTMNIKSGGNMALDGSIIDFNDGLAASATGSGLDALSEGAPTNNPLTDLDRVACDNTVEERSQGDGGDDPQKQEKDVESGKKAQEDVDRGKQIAQAGCKRSDTNKPRIVAPTPYKLGEFVDYKETPMSIQLSANFRLGDVVKAGNSSGPQNIAFWSSSQRSANGLTKAELLDNLRGLCVNVLEPIKKRFPQMTLTSSLRFGPAEAQHGMGLAADMQFGGGLAAAALYDAALWIRDNVAYDQLLLEYGTFGGVYQGWVHASFNPRGNRPIEGRNGYPKVATFMDHTIARGPDGQLKLYLCDLSRP
jgi:predicted chitinase